MSYKAIVAPITVRKHPNADKLQLGTVSGHQVVVGLNIKDGDVGCFFPTDGQLSHQMCVENYLYNESAVKELCATLLPVGRFGFFDSKRRVRAQKFRGEKSDGFWLPLESLKWTGYDVSLLKAGDTFTELNGQVVCNKYYTPATLRAMKGGTPPAKRDVVLEFPKHIDTEQFRYFIGSIPAGAILYLTEKLHGTSGRYGNVPQKKEVTGWRKFVRKLADYVVGDVPDVIMNHVHVNGSRNVTLSDADNGGYYGTNQFRYDVTQNISLKKGEILYFEIVGYVNETMPVMTPQPIDKKSLKEVEKEYGSVMTYTYGCAPGEHRMYVYRIAQVNEDGNEFDLPWPQVLQRCKELGLEPVPTFAGPIVYNGDTQALEKLVNDLTDGKSTLDSRHIREGVVLRVESEHGTRYYKNKSFTFGVLEGYIKDQDGAVDLEEAA